MRLAVSGSRSLVAQALKSACARAGDEMLLLGRGAGADLVFDLTDPAQESPKLTVDALIMCSASFGGPTVEGLAENVTVNVLGALRMLQLAAANGIGRFVYLSSLSALSPNDTYGLSKAMAEDALRLVAPSAGVGLTILRPAQLYDDAGAAARHQPLFYHMVRELRAGRDIWLHGTRDVMRNYLHVDDLAVIILECVRAGTTGTFNAVHPHSLSVRQVAETIRDALNSSAAIGSDPSKPDLTEVIIPEIDNIFSRFPDSPPRSLRDGLKVLADWTGG